MSPMEKPKTSQLIAIAGSMLSILSLAMPQVCFTQSPSVSPEHIERQKLQFTAIQDSARKLLNTLAEKATESAATIACYSHRIVLLSNDSRRMEVAQIKAFLNAVFETSTFVDLEYTEDSSAHELVFSIRTKHANIEVADRGMIVIEVEKGNVSAGAGDAAALCRNRDPIPASPEAKENQIKSLAKEIVNARDALSSFEAIQLETVALSGSASATESELETILAELQLRNRPATMTDLEQYEATKEELEHKLVKLNLLTAAESRPLAGGEELGRQIDAIARFPAEWIAEHGVAEQAPCAPLEITPARKLYATYPKYTREAQIEGVQGIVIVQGTLDKQGKLTEIKVLKGLPYGLTESAVEAFKDWKFEPAKCRGTPIPTHYNATMNFRLKKKKR